MSKMNLLNVLFQIVGLLILFTIFYQNYFSIANRSNFSPPNYFSYFTVLSNIFVALTFIIFPFNLLPSRVMNLLRFGATLYILITCLVFITILGGKNDEFLSWANIMVHYVSPLAMLLNLWLFHITVLEFKDTLIWIVLLFIYFFYTLIRGAVIGWYPYNFIDPNIVGYRGVILYTIINILMINGLNYFLFRLIKIL